jgi:hypothetical protein
MNFEFVPILERYGVRFIERGKQVTRGNIGVRCPFCADDPSFHMGINVETGMWHCWRDESHKGTRPERLLVALLRISWQEAHALVMDSGAVLSIDELQNRAAALFTAPEKRPNLLKPMELERDFKAIREEGYRSAFFEYLVEDRGYPREDVPRLVKRYHLMSSMSGRFRFRIIMPFLFHQKVVGWTARTIREGGQAGKYLSEPDSTAVKQQVYNYDSAAKGGRVLLVVEGPMDAQRVDFYGWKAGVRSVSLLGTSATPEQLGLLMDLSYRFDEVFICLDADALTRAMALQSQLTIIGAKLRLLPASLKDPGQLLPNCVIPFALTGKAGARP